MKDIHELRNLTSEELEAELLSLRKQQMSLRIQKANDSLNKKHLVVQVRRTIARIKTIRSERVGVSHDK